MRGEFFLDQKFRDFQKDPAATLSVLGGGEVRFSSGSVFLHQGLPVTHLYCILEGTVKIEANEWEDRSLLVCFSRPPAFLGDVEALGDQTLATCTITAVTGLRLWRIDRDRFRSRMELYPWVLGLLARNLADKVVARARTMAQNQLCPLPVRYEAYLREMDSSGSPVPIRLEETSACLGISPRQLQRVIRELVEQGRLERRGRFLRVKAPDWSGDAR
jgi:CRP-like cAMP-binding protein